MSASIDYTKRTPGIRKPGIHITQALGRNAAARRDSNGMYVVHGDVRGSSTCREGGKLNVVNKTVNQAVNKAVNQAMNRAGGKVQPIVKTKKTGIVLSKRAQHSNRLAAVPPSHTSSTPHSRVPMSEHTYSMTIQHDDDGNGNNTHDDDCENNEGCENEGCDRHCWENDGSENKSTNDEGLSEDDVDQGFTDDDVEDDVEETNSYSSRSSSDLSRACAALLEAVAGASSSSCAARAAAHPGAAHPPQPQRPAAADVYTQQHVQRAQHAPHTQLLRYDVCALCTRSFPAYPTHSKYIPPTYSQG